MVPFRWLVVVLSMVPSVAHAGEVAVSFAQAADAAGRGPLVRRAEEAQRGLREAGRAAPGLDANPVITIQVGPRVAPGKERGLEGGVGVSQSFSLEGAARLRRRALEAEARTAAAVVQTQRVTLRLAASRAWLELWAAQRLWAAARQDAEAARRSQRAVETLVTARERTRAEALVARRQAEEAALRALAAEGALAEARIQLKAELGLAVDATPVAAGEPPEVVAPTAGERQAALAAVAAAPAVRARALLAAEERVRAAEERAARGSRISLGVQVQRDAIGATVLLGQVSVPLPLLDVGGREEAPRKAAALRAEGEAEEALRRARSDLQAAFHEIEHTDEVEEAVRKELLPAAEQALGALERGFSAGEVTLLEKIDGQRSLLEARSRQVVAARDRAWARIRAATLVAATRGGEP